MPKMTSCIATSDVSSVTVRGQDLVDEIIGRRSFTQMVHFLTVGSMPTQAEVDVLDACLVTLMEHGLNPSTIVARLTYDSVPNELQLAMANGLAVIGDVFAGTMEGAAQIIADGLAADDQSAFCEQVVADFKSRKEHIPGFGHATHKPDDPRTHALLSVAERHGLCASEIAFLKQLGEVVDKSMGRHITINATGGIAAVLLGIGYQPHIMRGIAVISRSGGLLGHLLEERAQGLSRGIVAGVRRDTEYVPTQR